MDVGRVTNLMPFYKPLTNLRICEPVRQDSGLNNINKQLKPLLLTSRPQEDCRD